MRALPLDDEVTEMARGQLGPIAIPAAIGLHPESEAFQRAPVGQTGTRRQTLARQLTRQVI